MEKIRTESEGRVDKFMCPGRRLALVTSASPGVSAFALALAIFACSRESPRPVNRNESPMMTLIPSAAAAGQNKKGVAMKGFVQDIEGLAIIRAGFAVLVPAGENHNIINTGTVPMKLYTLYAPPNHRDGVVHHTRHEAEADNEHFDGKTTE